MKARKSKFFQLLSDNTPRTLPPTPFIKHLTHLLHVHGHESNANEAAELAEREIPTLVEEINEELNLAFNEGLSMPFELFGNDDDYIRGTSFADNSLPDRDKEVRSHRAHIDDLHSSIRSLTYSEFELACSSILQKMGCINSHTSQRSNDGGIDFYGNLRLEGRLDYLLPLGGLDQRVGLWLIGQAKHYPNRDIKPNYLRELVGSIELARTKGATQSWEGLSLRPFDAVIHLFFTTGDFSRGAKELLENSGIVSMNGWQLSHFLCDVEVGITKDGNHFSDAKFRKDLGL